MQEDQRAKLTGAFELLGLSIQLIRKYLGVFFILLAVPALVSVSTSVDSKEMLTSFNGIGALVTLVFFAPSYYAACRAAGGHDITLNEAFRQGYKYFWRLLGLGIVVGLIILLGFILLIVPGFIMMRRYALAGYVLIDRNLSIGEAMKVSADESKSFSWSIYSIFGVYLLFSLLGILGLPGMIASYILIFLYSLALPIRYFEIKKANKSL